jgi:hypothetical protein
MAITGKPKKQNLRDESMREEYAFVLWEVEAFRLRELDAEQFQRCTFGYSIGRPWFDLTNEKEEINSNHEHIIRHKKNPH